MDQKNLEIAKYIHKYKAIWEASRKDPNPLIVQAAQDLANEKEKLENIEPKKDNKDQEYMRQIITMHYQILLNASEIYKGLK